MTTFKDDFGRWAMIAIAILGTGCSGAEPEAGRGQALYTYCESCHGADGSGNETYHAPAIAGLDAWYLEAQLDKFRSGDRGTHPADDQGLRMRPMALTLKSDEDVAAIAGYVANLPAVDPAPTLAGDPESGRALYEPCVQCHGEGARGNREKSAPDLTHNHDWYLARQLRSFKDGVRGADPDDVTGGQMRPMALSLPNEEAIADVVAYIMTLPAE